MRIFWILNPEEQDIICILERQIDKKNNWNIKLDEIKIKTETKGCK